MKKIEMRYRVIIALLSVVALLLAGALGVSVYRHRQTAPAVKDDKAGYGVVTDTAYDNTYDTIEVSSNYGNVFILPSGDTRVYLKIWGYEEKTEITEVGSFLYIIADARDNHKKIWQHTDLEQVRIELYLPADYDKTLQLKTNYGNFEVESFPQMQLKAESDYGNLSLGEVASLEASFQYGSLEADTIHSYVAAECDMGNIEIEQLTITEDSQLACDMGSIHIKNAPTAAVEASTDLGSVSVRPDPAGSAVRLTLESDNGSITVE